MAIIKKFNHTIKNIPQISHNNLVNRAEIWLRSKRYTVTAKELHTSNQETPDVMGFRYGGDSCLVECKASRSDFSGDKNKSFRRDPTSGMGQHRYYAVPAGLVKPEELPEGWGLLYVYEKTVREIRHSAKFEADKDAEVNFLVSIIRRLRMSAAVFVEKETE